MKEKSHVKGKQNTLLEKKVIDAIEIVSAKWKLSSSISHYYYFTMLNVNIYKPNKFIKENLMQ